MIVTKLNNSFPQEKKLAALGEASTELEQSNHSLQANPILAQIREIHLKKNEVTKESYLKQQLNYVLERKHLIGTAVLAACLFPQVAILALVIGGTFGALKYFANKLDGIKNEKSLTATVMDTGLGATVIAGILSTSTLLAVSAVVVFSGIAIMSFINNIKQDNKWNAGLDLVSLGLVAFSARQILRQGFGKQINNSSRNPTDIKSERISLELKTQTSPALETEGGFWFFSRI